MLAEHPSYGHKRLALVLQRNKKCVLRVMKKFSIKALQAENETLHQEAGSWFGSVVRAELRLNSLSHCTECALGVRFHILPLQRPLVVSLHSPGCLLQRDRGCVLRKKSRQTAGAITN